MMLRILPSDDQFEVVDFVSNAIAQWKNAHLFWDLKEVPEVERRAEIEYYEEWMEELSH